MTRRALRHLWPLILLILGCSRGASDPSKDPANQASLLAATPQPAFASSAALVERAGSGRVRYLGLDVSPAGPLNPGDVLELTHYFEVVAPFAGDYQVFVHGETPGGTRLFVGDHAPLGGRVPTRSWKKGQIWKDSHRVQVPKDATGPSVDLFVGLFRQQERLTVEAPAGQNDGRDRLRIARIALRGKSVADDLPTVTIPKAKNATITADGVLDEAAWKDAVVLRFSDSMGRGTPVRHPTTLRLLWDDKNLYAAFESEDVDISCKSTQRDDPIYDHESVELFIMPHKVAPELGPYIELQASPKGVIFDASFTARRQGMDKRFDGRQTVGTKLDGTLNQAGDTDRGWVSEWIVPWKDLRYVKGPPKAGDEWRMNAFRIENKGEYTAWSPPKVGDFHNVDRFGRMRFGE